MKRQPRSLITLYPNPSTMSAKLINPTNMTSSFSNREKTRCKPLSLRYHRDQAEVERQLPRRIASYARSPTDCSILPVRNILPL